MQIIRSILKIESGVGQWVNDSGSGAVTPSFLLGVQAKLVLDLRSPLSDDAEEATLPPYPPEELEGLSFIFAMDLDYDAATPCKFIKNSGITMGVDPLGRLLCTIPLPNTDTETMREALSTAPMLAFNCELIARNAEDADVFAVQFPMTVLNRVLLGEATPSPDTESPEWLPTVSAIIRQVVAENADSLKGKPGDPGAPGTPGESAYDTWKAQDGNEGKTEQEFLDALKGRKGDPGEKGADASVEIGTVETVDSPGEASAEIVGGVLNLRIPKGPKGDKGASMLFSFAATASANLPDWHAHCLPTDHYWRVSEDGGASWTSPRPLQAPAIAPVARFSRTPQVTNPVWTSPEQKEEFVELPASSAYFRVRMSGYPWTEPRLISAPNGIDTMPADEVAAQEATLKAATIRAQFSADGQEGSWHAAIEEGDLYVKFFSTNGAVAAIWNLSAFGAEHSLEALQASPTGPQWHDNPLPGDKYMKISLDGGETWYSNCFVIAADQVAGGTTSPGASLTIGTVTTLPPGSQATASIVDGVLNLGIPQGAPGQDGGGSGTSQTAWGGIGGALSDQSDLKAALDAKAEKSEVASALSSASTAQGMAQAAKSAVDAHAADSSVHVPSGGAEGQVLTKTATGAQWKNVPVPSYSDSITEFGTTTREWTEADVGKLFRYTGETSGQFFKNRLYLGVSWKTSNFDYEDVPSGDASDGAAANAASASAGGASGETPTLTDWPKEITVGTLYHPGPNPQEVTEAWALAVKGTYHRTGQTLTVLGEEVPVWSNGSAYIHGTNVDYGEATQTLYLACFYSASGYTPSATQELQACYFSRKKADVTKPSDGTTVTGNIGDKGFWSPGTIATGTIVGSLTEEFYSGDGGGSGSGAFPPAPCSGGGFGEGCVEFFETHYGCAPVLLGAGRDWTDDQEDWDVQTTKTPPLTCYPGARYYANIAADTTRTINAGTYQGPPLAECEVVLDIQEGGGIVCGPAVTLRGTVVAGQVNFCRLVWTGNSKATLIVQ